MSDRAVEVTVRGIASGGSGVGELPDGRVVFVPRTAPGDRARIDIVKEKSRWAVGALRRLVEPAPDRVEAPCKLYAACGGCQLQHLPYERQLEWKGRFVSDALTRLGGFGAVEPPEVVPSPRTLQYRNRMSFTLRRLRGGRVIAGLHGLARPAHVVDVIDECLLAETTLMEAWRRLRAAWGPGASALPTGGRLRLTLRTVEGGCELVVEGGGPGWDAAPLAEAAPELVAIHHRAGNAEGTLAELRTVHGEDGAGVGGAFEQVNPAASELLRVHVRGLCSGAASVVDAYCGTGELAAELAAAGSRVTGIELDPGAVARARARGPEGLTLVEGRVEATLADHLPTDLLIVNPPRSGLDASVPAVIVEAPPARIVYVSCDPATLARDLAALTSAFALAGLRAFDLFPQTAHVETVALLERVSAE